MSFDNFSTTLTRIADILGHESLLLLRIIRRLPRPLMQSVRLCSPAGI